MNAKAFTLAEALITLGIIGVVAAMTLPTLVQRYKEQETVTRVKKFYSGFSQAYMQAVMDNGTIDNWGLTDSAIVTDDNNNSVHSEESLENYDKFLEKMKPYLKNMRNFQQISLNLLVGLFYLMELQLSVCGFNHLPVLMTKNIVVTSIYRQMVEQCMKTQEV